MIDFACKRFKLSEIIKCGLGLTRAEYKVLEYFIDHEDLFSTEQLAENIGLNLSTIQRTVKKLFEKDLLTRNQNNLKTGGYVFLYQIKDKTHVKEIILNIINNWSSKVKEALDKW